MSNKINHKKSGMAGDVPAVTDLDAAELLYNYADGIAFFKKITGGVESIVEFHGSATPHLFKHLSAPSNPAAGFVKLYSKSDSNFYIKNPAGVESKIWSEANHGTGSGLDADKLDGNEASYFQQAITVNPNKLLGRYSATIGAVEEIQIGSGLSLVENVLKASGGSSYTHPTGFSNQPGTALINGYVISQIAVNSEGHVTGVSTRQLTYSDVNAQEEILVDPWSLVGNPSSTQQLGIQMLKIGTGLTVDVNGNLNVTVGGGSGTVSSVALSMPNMFSVSGSPITTNGTFNVTLAQQGIHAFFAGPSDVAAGVPQFRTILASDLPSLPYQDEDADLSAIASLTGTGYLKRTGDNAWALDAGAGGGIENTYTKVELSNSPSPIAASTWTNITGVSITINESGSHLVTCHVSLVMGSTAGYVAARLRIGTTVIASSETYQNYRADFHLSNIVNVTGAVTVQIYSSVTGTSPLASTQTSGSGSATILHVIKLS